MLNDMVSPWNWCLTLHNALFDPYSYPTQWNKVLVSVVAVSPCIILIVIIIGIIYIV